MKEPYSGFTNSKTLDNIIIILALIGLAYILNRLGWSGSDDYGSPDYR